ncbi:MAG: pyruvate, phosphate dikinase [Deltaproteobacteria bacterium]|nr:pyruvate, phosphate dikinase [Deltaproteobacteria bacterium]
MPADGDRPSTGLTALDRLFHGVMPGDNIVWQVFSVDDYLPFVAAYCRHAIRLGAKLVYFRFARHRELMEQRPGVERYALRPEEGFEPFVTEIHSIIEESGPGAYFVFDCLSDLVVEWGSDRMLGNFFMLTCPYVFDHRGVAYFALFKHSHSYHTTTPVSQTAQIMIDVYRYNGKLYLRPTKVEQRHSRTMQMLHLWEDEAFNPVEDSKTYTTIMSEMPWDRQEGASHLLGLWTNTFRRAKRLQAAIDRGESPAEEVDAFTRRLLLMLIGKRERLYDLACRYLALSDVIKIRHRMVGTGPIGGKSLGMLLAHAILQKTDPKWTELLEPHDSFFIGADVFYTYLVQNGLWWIKQKQKDPQLYLSGAELARHQMLKGTFPDYLVDKFTDVLDYFGPVPLILRSSSLLEDSFDSALAGKAKSVFCLNQGSRDQRIAEFINAIRTIYASYMSEETLKYRSARGLLEKDERMAVLVQRVSGVLCDKWYFPHLAGVGLSFNPYVWNETIDPAAGVLRLVFGLGTRAVNTTGGDFTRLVALNAPLQQVESAFTTERAYAQRKVDILDLERYALRTADFSEVVQTCPSVPFELIASRDARLQSLAMNKKSDSVFAWSLTFEKLLTQTTFVDRMRELLSILQQAYENPVDIEFTVNFQKDGSYCIGLVQCRPTLVQRVGISAKPPETIDSGRRVLESQGPVIGRSREMRVDRLIYIVPALYGRLMIKDRYKVAKLVGELTRLENRREPPRIMLVGPGRWGTTTPSLGIPISFAEIKRTHAVCEIVAMREGLTPEVSLGTHFFNELVETDILYFALYPERRNDFLNEPLLESFPNQLPALLPEQSAWAPVVRVLDTGYCNDAKPLCLIASAHRQRVLCYQQL